MTELSPLELATKFVQAMEAGAGAEEIRPLLAEDFILTEWPHALNPEGGTRNLEQTLSGAEQAHQVVSEQSYRIKRSTVQGERVVLEIEWSATAMMDLNFWNTGQKMRARVISIFEVKNGQIQSQDSYDCYFTNDHPEPVIDLGDLSWLS
ncbi:nuclear transport factor 2 family protein [Pseudarthrobacter sp. J1763]|uniref:nuclear transport factor 2 family protein n=1 Tax=Pseudarthrobacter sp. J1763 TaxID=3420445 RepID=UPI003D2CA813